MQPAAPQPLTREDTLRLDVRNAGVPDNEATALNKEGFPDYMIMAFLQLAEGMRTAVANGAQDDKGIEDEDIIVSSRVPGGAGADLMEAGYDLKGFQIKAKSCDWGPMAGFICQLPFLNKAGYEKIAYNTGYIAGYLTALESFAGTKDDIAVLRQVAANLKTMVIGGVTSTLYLVLAAIKIEADKVKAKPTILSILTEPQKGDLLTDAICNQYNVSPWSVAAIEVQEVKLKEIKKKIYKVCEAAELALTKKYKAAERVKATWSGENEIPQVAGAPFVQLKRRFSNKASTAAVEVKKMNGVLRAEPLAGSTSIITGTAVNNSDDPLPNRESLSTIKVDFVLVKDPEPTDPKQLLTASPNTALWSIYYQEIFYRSGIDKAVDASKVYKSYTTTLSDLEITNLKLRGELRKINDKEDPKDYENYVQGLLGRMYTNTAVEKTADTPAVINTRPLYPMRGIMNPHPPYKDPAGTSLYKNAVSGDFDLFAFWPSNATSDLKLVRMSEQYLRTSLKFRPEVGTSFWLEFIPSFSELVDANKQNLKESAEEGNIHELGRQVSGILNSLANTLHTKFYDLGRETGPKSDVNSAFHSDEGGRPGIMEVEFPIAFFLPRSLPAPAPLSDTKGGLIRNPTELLALMRASCKAGYQVIMHSAWMIHFFYISKPPVERALFQSLLSEKKQKEFATLERNHAEMYPAGNPFVEQTFENSLKALFGLPDDVFNNVREAFLAMASSSVGASDRMESVRQLIIRR